MQRARERFVAAFSVLQIHDMRRVWASQVLSEVGDWAARFALAVLVYDRTGSPFLTAATLAVTYLPYLLSPIITPVVQRYSLRRMMIGSDLVRMVLFALIALPLPTWSLLVLAFVAGTATPPFEAARTAVIPEAAGEERMADGYALSNVTFQTAQAFGLAVGGALLLFIGPEAALILNAATFGVSAVLLVSIQAGRTPPPPEPPIVRTRQAFTLVARRGLLRQMLMFFLLLALADAADQRSAAGLPAQRRCEPHRDGRPDRHRAVGRCVQWHDRAARGVSHPAAPHLVHRHDPGRQSRRCVVCVGWRRTGADHRVAHTCRRHRIRSHHRG